MGSPAMRTCRITVAMAAIETMDSITFKRNGIFVEMQRLFSSGDRGRCMTMRYQPAANIHSLVDVPHGQDHALKA